MHRFALIMLLTALLSGCLELPTLQVTPTTVTSTPLPTATTTDTPLLITIIGYLYVRNTSDQIIGLLKTGEMVQATCTRDWCILTEGNMTGMKFWRGCGSDNPENRRCQPR